MEPVPSRPPRSRLAEQLFRSFNALATLSIAVYGIHAAASSNQQALHHYRIERVMLLAERFNGSLVAHRQAVDQFIASGLAPEVLLERAEARLAGKHDPGDGDRYLELARDVKIFANFFQEVGVAMRHEILEEHYAWDVFGGLSKKYGRELKPFIIAMRARARRPTLYQDFDRLVERMHRLDDRYDGLPPPGPTTGAELAQATR